MEASIFLIEAFLFWDKIVLLVYSMILITKVYHTSDTFVSVKNKKHHENNALQRAKSQSSARIIIGPANVLAIELHRRWETRVSSDGVSVQYAQLRMPVDWRLA